MLGFKLIYVSKKGHRWNVWSGLMASNRNNLCLRDTVRQKSRGKSVAVRTIAGYDILDYTFIITTTSPWGQSMAIVPLGFVSRGTLCELPGQSILTTSKNRWVYIRHKQIQGDTSATLMKNSGALFAMSTMSRCTVVAVVIFVRLESRMKIIGESLHES